MFSPANIASIINAYLPEPQASLLNGIVLGINLQKNTQFYEQLKNAGLLHLVVLSGTNITLLAALISKITEFLGKQISLLLTILIVFIFILFVGAQAPIVRAGFMGILTLVAILYGKKYTALYILFLSLIFISLFWPDWLTSLSLQLSYGATLGIILFGSKKKQPYIINQLQLSLAAQIFTVPLIFFYFKQVSLISPIANILVAWFICPLMIFGFLTVLLGSINYYLGLLPAYICYGILTYIVFVVELLAKIPFAFFNFK